MIEVWSIVHNEGHQEKDGFMFLRKDNFKEYDLVKWVYKNCKAADEILIIPSKYVKATYPDRTETYYMKEVEHSQYDPDPIIAGKHGGSSKC